MDRLQAGTLPISPCQFSSCAGGLEQRMAILESENAQMMADVAHIRNSGGQADRLTAVLRRDVARSQEVCALGLSGFLPWLACRSFLGMPGLSGSVGARGLSRSSGWVCKA